MKILIDENMAGNYPGNPHQLLTAAGHEVRTVYAEGLEGSTDPQIMRHCIEEQQCLITLDKDFGNNKAYKPHKGPGIILLCLGLETTPARVRAALQRASILLSNRRPTGKLWIITPDNFLECPQGISKRKLRRIVKKILQREREFGIVTPEAA